MQKINVQYSCSPWLKKLFACPYCKKQELMFGCPDKNCPNYWKKNLKDAK